MDFHSLPRRELQAFCKRNKIPANMTNAAMAEALQALKIVEGIEEFMQQSQSESAQSSSIELPEGSEVTSPYVPPTGGRSTRRRNVLKDDIEAVTSAMTRTRRTTRKAAIEVCDESQVDSMETPAVMAQASRRKVQIASACLKMDSQLKECMEEKKKDAVMTPAAVGATSRRRRVVEETEKKVYSTRRSVRLAVKNVQKMNDVQSEESELSNMELFAKDCQDQEVKVEGDCNEMSGITGDAIESIEEKSEVVSAEKQDIAIPEEEETSMDFAVEVKPDEEICVVASANTEYPGDEDMSMPVNVSHEVQQIEGSVDVCPSEIEVKVEKSEEVNNEIGAGSQDEANEFVKNVHLENRVSDDMVDVEVEDDKEMMAEDVQDFSATLDSLTELTLQHEEFKQMMNTDEMETLEAEESEEVAVNEVDGVEKLEAASVEMGEQITTSGAGADDKAGLDSQEIVQPTLITGYSDNKENNIIGSGSEVVIMKEKIKPAKSSGESVNLHELSMAKLSKMLKEKLEITNKSSTEVVPRTALKVLPENH